MSIMLARKLTIEQAERLWDFLGCGPLVYRPEVDAELCRLGWLQEYDETGSVELSSVCYTEHGNFAYPFFKSFGLFVNAAGNSDAIQYLNR